MNDDGTDPQKLTNHPRVDTAPHWSPNGEQIVFSSTRDSFRADQFFNLYRIDADGSNVQQITDFGFGTRPRWSPDGEWLLFGGRGIHVCRTDGTDLSKITPPNPAVNMAVGGWSPDGRQILYIETIEGQVTVSAPVIATLARDGRATVIQWKRIKLPQLAIKGASFSTHGQSILFAGTQAEKGDDWNIYRFELITKKLIQLTDNPGNDNSGPSQWNPQLSVSPQQKTISLFWGEIKSD
ncbi:hypothetical protein F4X33_05415 [Candidatus Poribacteria bacterium]|nr:hypothetical protein [Candidatus Poribacteria bacterium]